MAGRRRLCVFQSNRCADPATQFEKWVHCAAVSPKSRSQPRVGEFAVSCGEIQAHSLVL
jgi:hypothetical protein